MKTAKELTHNRESEHRILRCIAIAILAILALDVYVLKIFNHDWTGFLELAVFCAYEAGMYIYLWHKYHQKHDDYRIMIWSFLCIFLVIQYWSMKH